MLRQMYIVAIAFKTEFKNVLKKKSNPLSVF